MRYRTIEAEGSSWGSLLCISRSWAPTPARLRSYYGELFGWEFSIDDAVTQAVSAPGHYGFVDGSRNGTGDGINGGVGGGDGYAPRVLFYVGARRRGRADEAQSLGGTPDRPGGDSREISGRAVTDPEGNLIGVAGTK